MSPSISELTQVISNMELTLLILGTPNDLFLRKGSIVNGQKCNISIMSPLANGVRALYIKTVYVNIV